MVRIRYQGIVLEYVNAAYVETDQFVTKIYDKADPKARNWLATLPHGAIIENGAATVNINVQLGLF